MEVIRFQCPACSAPLTVPPEAAGFQGACPKCAAEIIGPNPALGLPASLPVVAPPPAKAFEPFPEQATPVSIPQPPPTEPAPELIPPSDPFAGSAIPQETLPPPQPDIPPSPPETKEPELPGPELPEPELSEPVPAKEEEPFKDFTPPPAKPENLTSLPPAPTVKRSGPSVAVLVLSCLLTGVLAFVAGYSSRRITPDTSGPIFTSNPITPPTESPDPIPVPVRTWIPDPTTDEDGEPTVAGPEATLNAFLTANGWAARSAYVMFPESVRPRMEEHAKKSNDGPIETTDISLFEITKQAHIFKVSTPKVPEGFPVAVTRDNNSWQIDWETFVEFHDDRFLRFATGKGDDHGVFHLLVKPAEAAESDTLFERFLLNPPMPGREQSAYIKKGSVTLARLQGIFERRAGQTEEVFDKLLEGQGPPMVLALSYKVNSQGQSYIQIDDVVAIGWGPGAP